VSGVAGAELGAPVILVLGLANLLADGFSMAVGAYLSLKSEREYYAREHERETWETAEFPEGEQEEMVQIYRRHGYEEEDARTLVKIQFRNPKHFVRTMMAEELGLFEHDREPLWSGVATFVAFIIAGSVPLAAFLARLVVDIPYGTAYMSSILLTAVALFGLGAAKVLITGRSMLRSGFEMLLVGSLAAGVAYGIGALLKGLLA